MFKVKYIIRCYYWQSCNHDQSCARLLAGRFRGRRFAKTVLLPRSWTWKFETSWNFPESMPVLYHNLLMGDGKKHRTDEKSLLEEPAKKPRNRTTCWEKTRHITCCTGDPYRATWHLIWNSLESMFSSTCIFVHYAWISEVSMCANSVIRGSLTSSQIVRDDSYANRVRAPKSCHHGQPAPFSLCVRRANTTNTLGVHEN